MILQDGRAEGEQPSARSYKMDSLLWPDTGHYRSA